VGADAPAFALTSFAECAATLAAALDSAGREEACRALQVRLAPRCDPARTFAGVMAAYARAAQAV
jgi:hypothetical protein